MTAAALIWGQSEAGGAAEESGVQTAPGSVVRRRSGCSPRWLHRPPSLCRRAVMSGGRKHSSHVLVPALGHMTERLAGLRTTGWYFWNSD